MFFITPCVPIGIPTTHLFQMFVGVCDAFKKRGERGNAFKVANDRGKLCHLQIEIVSLLWPLHEKITV